MVAGAPTGPVEIPALVRALAERIDDVVWQNEIGGHTFVADGRFVGHVDFGAIGVGDRWADLSIASMSLDGNFGPGWHDEFFAAYDIERDEQRIRYYRAAWDAAP